MFLEQRHHHHRHMTMRSITATAPMESSLDAWNHATQDDAAPDLPRQQRFLLNIDLTLGYLQSDQFMSATPPGDAQSPNQRGRISKILGEQPYGAATQTAQTRDTDGRGGNKESTPQGPNQGRNFCWDFAQPSQVVRGDVAKTGCPWGASPAGTCGDYRETCFVPV